VYRPDTQQHCVQKQKPIQKGQMRPHSHRHTHAMMARALLLFVVLLATSSSSSSNGGSAMAFRASPVPVSSSRPTIPGHSFMTMNAGPTPPPQYPRQPGGSTQSFSKAMSNHRSPSKQAANSNKYRSLAASSVAASQQQQQQQRRFPRLFVVSSMVRQLIHHLKQQSPLFKGISIVAAAVPLASLLFHPHDDYKPVEPTTTTSTTATTSTAATTTHVHLVETLEDFQSIVGAEQDRPVAVFFQAPFCKACKAVAPHFVQLSKRYNTATTTATATTTTTTATTTTKGIKFVQVPLSSTNQKLLQGLGIERFPTYHIYHPTLGLIDQGPLLRKLMNEFEAKLKSVHSSFQQQETSRLSSSSSSSSSSLTTRAVWW
jgi:thiol-disulfide isomerase/thioredoxin